VVPGFIECLNVVCRLRRNWGCLLEPKWWSASAAGVPNRQNDQIVVERRVVDVVATTRQEDPPRASDGRSSVGIPDVRR
jgi:hypothetical protein